MINKIKEDKFKNIPTNNSIKSLRYFFDIMLGISYLGADFTIIATSCIVLFLAWKKNHKDALFFILTLSTGFFIDTLLKYLIKRPRPQIAPLLSLTSYSFPSGHAMNSFIFYATLAYFTYHFTRNKKMSSLAAILALPIIGLVGLSRIYLGVHYPSDVLAGFIAGLWWFTTAMLIEKSIQFLKYCEASIE